MKDRKYLNKEQLKAMNHNACPGSDETVLSDVCALDLDCWSVMQFKMLVSYRFPDFGFSELTDEEFLNRIGALGTVRGKDGLFVKKGALLFLGKSNDIHTVFPHLHLDYFYFSGDGSRWSDRIADDVFYPFEVNLFNFFRKVSDKMFALIKAPFVLQDDMTRAPDHGMFDAIREAMVNALAHADYEAQFPQIKVMAHPDKVILENPGSMMIHKEEFFSGGNSKPRNELILKLFRLMGMSERQGFGGPLIEKTARQFRLPMPKLDTNLEKTVLTIWTEASLADRQLVSADELIAFLKKNGPVSFKEIREYFGCGQSKLRSILKELSEADEIQIIGKGPSTRYKA